MNNNDDSEISQIMQMAFARLDNLSARIQASLDLARSSDSELKRLNAQNSVLEEKLLRAKKKITSLEGKISQFHCEIGDLQGSLDLRIDRLLKERDLNNLNREERLSGKLQEMTARIDERDLRLRVQDQELRKHQEGFKNKILELTARLDERDSRLREKDGEILKREEIFKGKVLEMTARVDERDARIRERDQEILKKEEVFKGKILEMTARLDERDSRLREKDQESLKREEMFKGRLLEMTARLDERDVRLSKVSLEIKNAIGVLRTERAILVKKVGAELSAEWSLLLNRVIKYINPAYGQKVFESIAAAKTLPNRWVDMLEFVLDRICVDSVLKLRCGDLEIANRSYLWVLFEEIFIRECYKFDDESPGDIIDCGSHVGLSVAFYMMAYPGRRVLCFEPNKVLYSILKRNIEKNSWAHVEARNCALSANGGKAEFYYPETEMMAGSLLHEVADRKGNVRTLKVATESLKPHLNSEIAFLKIDIEGKECEVLTKCGSSIKNARNIFIEYHPVFKEQGNELGKIVTLLEDGGFNIGTGDSFGAGNSNEFGSFKKALKGDSIEIWATKI